MDISTTKLKAYRAENGWSQEQLSEVSGISLRTIQRAEKDGRCSNESCMAIASAFGISPAELDDEFKSSIGDGSVNIGGLIGIIVICCLVATIIVWEWGDLNVFINVSALLFNILTLLSLSLMTCGLTPTFNALTTISWFVKQPRQIRHANQHLPVLRRLIIYSYTAGVFWTITDIVEASYYSFNGEQSRFYFYEIGLSSISILYAVLIAELVFRPLKNRIEFLLTHSD